MSTPKPRTPTSSSSATPFIELRRLSKTFKPGVLKRVQVVNELSCTFNAHQCTAFLGHNGAGKTTSIRMILGLIRPDKGEVLFQGRPMTREDRRLIGFMPEVSKLPMDLTCEEILSHQLHLYGVPAGSGRGQLITSKLEEVGLAAHRKKRIGQLSKGMARRLAWSQATIHSPEFLILDEPFSGLDPLARIDMQNWMVTLRSRGVGMLVCTHEFWSVRELCDEIYIISKGKVVFTSATDRAEQRERYALVLTDVGQPTLDGIATAKQLPAWQTCRAEEGNFVLEFNDPASAQAWLGQATTMGWRVAKFGKEPAWSDQLLLKHFA